MTDFQEKGRHLLEVAKANIAKHGDLMSVIVVFHGDEEMEVIGVPTRTFEERDEAWHHVAVYAKTINADAVMLIDDAYMKSETPEADLSRVRRGDLAREFKQGGGKVGECLIGRLILNNGDITVFNQPYSRTDDGVTFAELKEISSKADGAEVQQSFPEWWKFTPTQSEAEEAVASLGMVVVGEQTQQQQRMGNA